MEVYRISKREFASIDGIGGMYFSGRWHFAGNRVVYTAEHRSLAAVEYLVHLNSASLLQTDFVISTIYIPDNIDFDILEDSKLHKDWTKFSYLHETQQIGTDFLKGAKSPILRVPSAIISNEYNYLLNPVHSLAVDVKVIDMQDFRFDNRLVKG